MRRFNTIFYLLFLLLIMGAFASMAQNLYGLRIIGLVAFAFTAVFLIELFRNLKENNKTAPWVILEPLCLAILSFLFGLRVFYIHFPFIEWIFSITALVLAFVYFLKMLAKFRELTIVNKSVAYMVLIFYASLVIFLLSLALVIFSASISFFLGILAFVLLLAFIIASLMRGGLIIEGVKLSAFTLIWKIRDHSVIIASLFLLFTLYFGMNKLGIVPGIYSDEYPKAYFEMVNNTDKAKKKTPDGRYTYEMFMEQYKDFIKHQADRTRNSR